MSQIKATSQINWNGSIDIGANLITTSSAPTVGGHLANKTYADGVGTTTLASAHTYADGVGTTTLASAHTYADGVGTTTLNSAKTYADNLVQGLDVKASVICASTANVTISAPGTAIDGVTLAVNDRVLLKDQTAPAENGIYVFTGSATPMTRASDFNAWTELPGAFTFVEGGTVNADKGFTCTSNASGTLGTTAITWTVFSSAGSYTAGAGLTLSGSAFSISLGTNSGLSTASGLHVTLDASTLSLTSTGLKISNDGVSTYQLAKAAFGDGMSGGGGNAVTLNIDATMFQFSSNTQNAPDGTARKFLQIKPGGVTVNEVATTGIPIWTNMITDETPSGTINGTNKVFTLANAPRSGALRLFVNGLRQKSTDDYTISSATITMVTAPLTGDLLIADYYK